MRQLTQVMALGGRECHQPGYECEVNRKQSENLGSCKMHHHVWWPGVCQPLHLQAEHIQCSHLLKVVSVTNPTAFNQLLLPDPGIPTSSVHQSWSGTLHPSTRESTINLLGF